MSFLGKTGNGKNYLTFMAHKNTDLGEHMNHIN